MQLVPPEPYLHSKSELDVIAVSLEAAAGTSDGVHTKITRDDGGAKAGVLRAANPTAVVVGGRTTEGRIGSS